MVAIEADPDVAASAFLGGRGTSHGLGSASGLSRIRVCKRVLRVMRENNLLSPHRGRRRGGNPHDGEIVTHAPNLMWGTDGVRVFTVDDGWGWIFTAIEHWNAECVGGMCASEATASPPFSRSPWALRGCMTRPPPVRLGGWPCGWITAPSICRTTSPTRSSSGASSRPTRLRRRAPDQRRRREVQSHAQGTDRPWPHLPQHRGAAERRPRLRRTVQCPVARREERLPEPRSGPSGVGPRDVTQARRMRQTCVQGTGCDTRLDRIIEFDATKTLMIPMDLCMSIRQVLTLTKRTSTQKHTNITETH